MGVISNCLEIKCQLFCLKVLSCSERQELLIKNGKSFVKLSIKDQCLGAEVSSGNETCKRMGPLYSVPSSISLPV